jgi:protein translocase SecG subunit
MFSSLLLFAQAAANVVSPDPAQGPGGITYETINANGFSSAQWVMLAVYSLISLALIGTVLSQTHKSEGNALSMMGGGSAGPVAYKGKKSGTDNLDSAANFLAVTFIGLSIVMFIFFH